MSNRLIAAFLLGTATLTLGPVACKVGEDNAAVAPAAGTELGIQTAWMDTAVKPGDDFYGYANGGWMAKTEIPADRSNVASSNFQSGDQCVHSRRAISRRYISRPRRPRSWWK